MNDFHIEYTLRIEKILLTRKNIFLFLISGQGMG